MDWKNAFQNHLTMLGDFWVGGADIHDTALDAEEQSRLLNKTKELLKQQARSNKPLFMHRTLELVISVKIWLLIIVCILSG